MIRASGHGRRPQTGPIALPAINDLFLSQNGRISGQPFYDIIDLFHSEALTGTTNMDQVLGRLKRK